MAAGAAVPMPSPSSLLAASNKISSMGSAAAFSTQSLQLLEGPTNRAAATPSK